MGTDLIVNNLGLKGAFVLIIYGLASLCRVGSQLCSLRHYNISVQEQDAANEVLLHTDCALRYLVCVLYIQCT